MVRIIREKHPDPSISKRACARDKLITSISEEAHLVNVNLKALKRLLEIIEKALSGIVKKPSTPHS